MKNKSNILILIFLILFTGEKFSQNVSYVYSWYKYYEPVKGKIVGIWAHPDRWADIQRLKDLKYRWGFNYITFGPQYSHDKFNMAKQVGYSPSTNIMIVLHQDYYPEATQYEKCWAYYLDEPADKQIPFDKVQTMRTFFKTYSPNSPFIISGYKRNSDLINYTNSLADKVLFSSYIHWREVWGVWVSWPLNPDQRDDWTDMRNLFGNKFSMTWINAYQDLSEYNQLLGHASNLGLEGIWLFQIDTGPEADDNNINSFCTAAVVGGYLYPNYQQVRDCFIDGAFVSRQFVGPPYLSIPRTYNHSDRQFADLIVTNNRIDDYFASNSITAGGTYFFIIPAQKKSSFNSNKEIILKPGFKAELGCEFRAYITNIKDP